MAGNDRSGWLIVLAEAEALRWALANRRMAFSAGQCRKAGRIRPGDELVLYASRGAWHNPTRDESQLAGMAVVKAPVRKLPKPVPLAGREFTCGCRLEITIELPERAGVPIRPLVRTLEFVRRKDVWGQYFRSGLVEVPAADMARLRNALAAAVPRDSVEPASRI